MIGRTMIAVLASRFDNIARELAKSWADRGAVLMTCDDLSRPGWKDYPNALLPANGRATIAGRSMDFKDLEGVLVRLPYVCEEELGRIAAPDRGYVAEEMTAYLASWLSRLDCPLLNRPTPNCLAGPVWPAEKWVHLASHLGIPTRTVISDTRSPSSSSAWAEASLQTVTVVGEEAYGEAGSVQLRRATSLARAAGVELLAVEFAGSELVGVSLWPTMESKEVRAAALNLLLAPHGHRISQTGART